MQLSDTGHIAGSVVKVRLHPRLPRLAALGRDALLDELIIWDTSDARLEELLRLRVAAQPADPSTTSDPRKGRFMDLAFPPQHDQLAVVRYKEMIELWQLPQGQLLQRLGNGHADNAMAFSPDGSGMIYATRPSEPIRGNRRDTRMFDFETGSEVILDCETDTTFAFHPFEKIIAAGWNDQGGGEIRLLKPPWSSSSAVHSFDAPGWVDGLTFAPSGTSLSVMGGAGFDGHFCLEIYDFDATNQRCTRKRFDRVWQMTSAEERGWNLPWADQVVYLPDSSGLICPGASGELVELDTDTGAQTDQWKAHDRMVTTLDVDHQRGLLASGGRDGQIALWRAAGRAFRSGKGI